MPLPESDKTVCRKIVFEAKIDVEPGERAVVAVISTPAVDRDREVLLPKGADLTAFKKNPVVLWAHDYSAPPIGKAMWIKKTAEDIRAKIQFAKTNFAEEIFQLFQDGILKAFSVGFDPWASESHKPDEKELEANPEWAGVERIYTKWPLLEFSAVPIPANAEALAVAVSKGMDVSDALAVSFGTTAEKLHEEADKRNAAFSAPPTPEPAPLKRRALLGAPKAKAGRKRIRRIIVPVPVVFHLPNEEDVLRYTQQELDRLRGRV